MEIILLIVATILVLVGVIGSVLPALPGIGLNFVTIIILYFLRDDFISIYTIIFFGAITFLAIGVDYIMPIIKAKKIGTSKYGLLGLAIGMILGFFVLSFIGMMIGAFLGAVIGELIGGREMSNAINSGMATFWGTILATVIKLTISISMTIYFFIKLISFI